MISPDIYLILWRKYSINPNLLPAKKLDLIKKINQLSYF